MLTHAALEAVKQWKYKPYYLNGEPVEVETTINVNFTLGGRIDRQRLLDGLHLSFRPVAACSGVQSG